jgi:hypothetical protein
MTDRPTSEFILNCPSCGQKIDLSPTVELVKAHMVPVFDESMLQFVGVVTEAVLTKKLTDYDADEREARQSTQPWNEVYNRGRVDAIRHVREVFRQITAQMLEASKKEHEGKA